MFFFQFEQCFLNRKVISLHTNEGQILLEQSCFKENYELLQRCLKSEQQVWISYCGVASAVLILNAATNSSYYAQFAPFNYEKKQIIAPLEVISGMTLKRLGQLFEDYALNTQVFYARSIEIEQFRNLAEQYLSKPSCFVVVNYFRKTLDQFGWGHISPLGAYNSEEDSFLILDVAQNRSPVWVKTDILYQAMVADDNLLNESRGFVLIGVDDY